MKTPIMSSTPRSPKDTSARRTKHYDLQYADLEGLEDVDFEAGPTPSWVKIKTTFKTFSVSDWYNRLSPRTRISLKLLLIAIVGLIIIVPVSVHLSRQTPP